MARQENAPPAVAEPIPSTGSAMISIRVPQPAPVPLETIFLRRLSRLLHQESEWRMRVGPEDWRIKLIQRTIYSTYCDCAANNVGETARDLIRNRRYNP